MLAPPRLLLALGLACSALGICRGFVAPHHSRAHLHHLPPRAAGTPRPHHIAAAPSRQRHTIRAMFSGIVEEKGAVVALERKADAKLWDGSVGEGVELTVGAHTALEGAYLGCSIAVNGVCLTVTEYETDGPSPWFRVGLAPETLRRSNLGSLRAGDHVNVERALASGARNSGHFVQGHVDDVGEIVKFTPEGDSLWVRVRAPRELMRYIVPKGFVAIDGTSLTVCEVDAAESWFTFMLVAYTQQHIVLPSKTVGDKVNIEVDVLGKYVERSLASVLDRLDALEQKAEQPPQPAPAAAGGGGGDVEYRLGAVEHKVTSRDLVIDSVEARLLTIEKRLDIE